MFKIAFLLFNILFTISCARTVQDTDRAAEAMARAKKAEADVYAPRLYQRAESSFNKMYKLIEQEDLDGANKTATIVVEQADAATHLARKNKAKALITELQQTLPRHRNDKEKYSQGQKFLIDAISAYDEGEANPDLPINLTEYESLDDIYSILKGYDRAIALAQKGLDLFVNSTQSQTYSDYTVVKGDTLWDISDKFYKSPWLWPNIWRANKEKVKNPDLIYPKQQLLIPDQMNTTH